MHTEANLKMTQPISISRVVSKREQDAISQLGKGSRSDLPSSDEWEKLIIEELSAKTA